MPAECNGLSKGGDEDFAIRTSPQMTAYLPANVGGEFVIDIGRQLTEKIHAMTLAMRMALR